jgi:hypothetical protein
MSLKKFAQSFEVKFWDRFIPAMNESPFIQGVINILYQITHSKPGYITVIFLIWCLIGFLTGLVVAKLLFLMQMQ